MLNSQLVSPSISHEVIIGVTRDPQFGPLLMFGSGGVEVEGLGDVAFALAPLTEAEARQLLDETWAGRKLTGYRNIPAVDKEAVVQTILRLGQIAADRVEYHVYTVAAGQFTHDQKIDAVEQQVAEQLESLSRAGIARASLEHARAVIVDDLDTAVEVSNRYAPEHLILQCADARALLPAISNAMAAARARFGRRHS